MPVQDFQEVPQFGVVGQLRIQGIEQIEVDRVVRIGFEILRAHQFERLAAAERNLDRRGEPERVPAEAAAEISDRIAGDAQLLRPHAARAEHQRAPGPLSGAVLRNHVEALRENQADPVRALLISTAGIDVVRSEGARENELANDPGSHEVRQEPPE